ncbi:hypothetical protein [Sediminibacterium sp.]|uniref:hypothetical protein n=1 Tax=Sediminibacterium sp. TaxID=1917865 RepID=UPI002730293D|nr:hypothetical protein [Sediminibacterium sp.]MDP2421454.1 hypothetical protein [Sediminibacterium sp.]
MKKLMVMLVLCGCVFRAGAQSIDPVSLLIAKIIKAIDLQVQKLQNQTIWLQQAQQVAEHELSKLKLSEIADWQRKQQQLYAGYFSELQTVRNAVKTLPQVKQILSLQTELIGTYNRIAKDEVSRTAADGLMGLCGDILSSLQEVTNSNGLEMKDADRVKMISSLRDAMQDCLDNMKELDKQTNRLAGSKQQLQTDMKSLQRLKQ